MEIVRAETFDDIEEMRRLFREYQAFLGVDLYFQGYERELAALPGRYAPPGGAILLGVIGDDIAGCVAFRDLGDDVGEMKRLFVRPGFRGMGLGRRLSNEVITLARDLGYSLMRLDTLDTLTAAKRLYESLGFKRIESCYGNPLPGVVYMELALNPEPPDR